MFLNDLSELGLHGWPLVVAIGVSWLSIVVILTDKWPWEGLIDKSVHNYYNGEDEETE